MAYKQPVYSPSLGKQLYSFRRIISSEMCVRTFPSPALSREYGQGACNMSTFKLFCYRGSTAVIYEDDN